MNWSGIQSNYTFWMFLIIFVFIMGNIAQAQEGEDGNSSDESEDEYYDEFYDEIYGGYTETETEEGTSGSEPTQLAEPPEEDDDSSIEAEAITEPSDESGTPETDGQAGADETEDTELKYEPASDPPDVPADKLDAEEKILANRSLVLEPEFKPRMGLTFLINLQLLPKYLIGQPSAELGINFEFMYKSNLTIYVFGGAELSSDYNFSNNLLYTELMKENSGYSIFSEDELKEKDGGIGYGGGFGARIRFDDFIGGFYLGMGAGVYFYPTYAFEGGRAIPSGDSVARPKSVLSVLFVPAVITRPYVEGGYTIAKGKFLLELGAMIAPDLIFGNGQYIDLESEKFELKSGDAQYEINEYPISNTKFAIHIHLAFHFAIGARF